MKTFVSTGIGSVLLLLLVSRSGSAQIEHWHTLGLKEGLPQVRVYDLAQDPGGWMWAGTQGGIARYDGENFRVFAQKDGLPTNHVQAILPLEKDHVFLGHAYGSSFTTIRRDSVRPVQGIPESYGGDCNDLILTPDSLILAATSDGLLCFTRESGEYESIHLDKENGLRSSRLFRVFSMPGGRVGVIGVQGVDMISSDGDLASVSASPLPFPDDKGIPNQVSRIGEKGLIVLFDHSLERYGSLEALKQGEAQKVWALPSDVKAQRFTTNEKEYWVGLENNGLIRVVEGRLLHYTEKEGLPDDQIHSLLESRAGNVWFGTGSGIAYTSALAFQFLNMDYGLTSNDVKAIGKASKKELWVGTDQGIDRLYFRSPKMEKLVGSEHLEAAAIGFSYVRSIEKGPHGRLWVGDMNSSKVRVLAPDDGRVLKAWELPGGGAIKSFRADGKGDMWVTGIGEGTWRFDIDSTTGRIKDYQAIREEVVPGSNWNLYRDSKDRLWFATQNQGTGYLDGDGFHSFDTEGGFPHSRVGSITEDANGHIWFGSIGGGVIRYDGDGFHQIKASDGLSANNPFFVLADQQGSVWAGTNSGLDRIRIEEMRIEKYGPEKGLVGMEANQNACYRSGDNSVWFGTVKGVIRCAPSRLHVDTTPPQLHLREMRLFNESRPIRPGKVFTHQENHLTFEFIGVHPDDPGQIQYKYRLKGLESDWSLPDSRTSVTFNSLPPGEYEFQVLARNSDGVWTEDPLHYSFRVTPPFWQTPWFYTSSGILAVLLVFMIIRVRTRSLLRRQQELEEKVKERTRELKEERDRIATINKDLEDKNAVISRQKEETDRQKVLVESKNKEVTDSLHYAKRIQTALLKEEERVSGHLPDHFIFFQPKEIVSGDFYWAFEKEDQLYVTVADCTGHGVPGAFMSMLGVAFLNEICAGKEVKDPAEILYELREKVINELVGGARGEGLKDGMDISLFRMDLHSREIRWAGGNNPLWRVRPAGKGDADHYMISRDGARTLVEYRPDRKHIGLSDDHTAFTEHRFKMQEREVLYMFSDGFQDQFGGEQGKKYKSNNFKRFLLEQGGRPMADQRSILEREFNSWKGDMEQVDDVCVLGLAAG